jgi:hypothetical protein
VEIKHKIRKFGEYLDLICLIDKSVKFEGKNLGIAKRKIVLNFKGRL